MLNKLKLRIKHWFERINPYHQIRVLRGDMLMEKVRIYREFSCITTTIDNIASEFDQVFHDKLLELHKDINTVRASIVTNKELEKLSKKVTQGYNFHKRELERVFNSYETVHAIPRRLASVEQRITVVELKNNVANPS